MGGRKRQQFSLLFCGEEFSPCLMCVHYRGGARGAQYCGGVQYHGDIMTIMEGYLEYRGGCSVPWGIS